MELPINISDFYIYDVLNRLDRLQFEYLLPGTGRKPKNCIDYFPKSFCPSCGRVHLVKGNCGSPQCPDCHTDWRYGRLKSIFPRVLSYKLAHKKRLIHAVVSISPDDYPHISKPDDINRVRRDVYTFAKKKGFDGGLVIFHPWRLRDDKKDELKEISAGLDGWMPGEFALWRSLIKLDNWRDYVYWSPHFHLLGVANWLQPALESDPFVFKRVGDLQQPVDLVRASMYLLSHAGISVKMNSNSIFWFGGLARCNWSINRVSEKLKGFIMAEMRRLIHTFKELEHINPDVCPVCMVDYLFISHAPRFFNSFDHEKNERLKMCYRWATGVIPPPSKSEIQHILRVQSFN